MARLRGLSRLSDRALLDRLAHLVSTRSRLEAELLAHIGEVERRRLHEAEGYSSMFIYCVDELRLSESAAYKRITAARASRRFPPILEYMAANELHLSGVQVLAPHLTDENHRELLAAAKRRSKRAISAPTRARAAIDANQEPFSNTTTSSPSPAEASRRPTISGFDAGCTIVTPPGSRAS